MNFIHLFSALQQQQQTTNTVVVTAQPQPVVVSAPVFREYPVTMTNSKGQQVSNINSMLHVKGVLLQLSSEGNVGYSISYGKRFM